MAARIAVFNHLPEILDRFRFFLELHGYTVATFQQEIGTLPDAIPFSADLVILGHVRGFPTDYPDFIKALRDDPVTAGVPIIVCTTSEIERVEDAEQEKVQYVGIETGTLNLDYVLVAIRMALEPNGDPDS